MTTQEPLYLKSKELWAVCNVLYDLLKRRLSTNTKGLYAKEKTLEVSDQIHFPDQRLRAKHKEKVQEALNEQRSRRMGWASGS